jgi:FAD/FMN-containing dehydrogenase
MARLTSAQRSYLTTQFGERVTFDRAACRSGGAAADAVVQPETEEEVARLVRWAAKNAVPLTPRGRGTAAYGGAVPVRRGVVVSFARMDRVLAVDPEARTATVQAGAVWETLDRELAAKDLALRLYPTSYRLSTAGGWLAQGGAGVGSYEAGWFHDNVPRARVVLPDGTPWELAGPEVELAADAEGTTGLLTELTLRVQPRQELDFRAVACPDAASLEHFIYLIASQREPLWSLTFLNPRMAEAASAAARLGGPGPSEAEGSLAPEERLGRSLALPAAYVALLVFRATYRSLIDSSLPDLLGPCQAEPLPEDVARSLWDGRFDLARLLRAGPESVPADVVVPLAALGDFCNAVQREITRPLAVHGVVVRAAGMGPPEVALHGFVPSDSPESRRPLDPSLAREVVRMAEEHGGRPYGLGLYFARWATRAMGGHRRNRLRAFKRQEDPHDLMNPGKMFGGGRVETGLHLADWLGPLARAVRRLFSRKPPGGNAGQ